MTNLEKIFINWYGQEEWDKQFNYIKINPEEYNFSAEQIKELNDFDLNELIKGIITDRDEFYLEESNKVESIVYDLLDSEITIKDLYLNYYWYLMLFTDYIIPDCLEGNKEYVDLI